MTSREIEKVNKILELKTIVGLDTQMKDQLLDKGIGHGNKSYDQLIEKIAKNKDTIIDLCRELKLSFTLALS